ncbi:MAG: hypothetical protein GX907_00455 [Clostridiaceae bacterium]|nr:hypothetical protein [Clostridiaceae bacterium]
MSKILAEISIGEVSPPQGIQLGGYPHYERLNTGIHDPLYATWLYLKDERSGEQTLIMSSDLLNFSRSQVDKIKQAIIVGSNIGLQPEQINVTCSHTHSAPITRGGFRASKDKESYVGPADEDYVAWLLKKCADLGLEALANTFPAEIAQGKAYRGKEHGIKGNRRDPENGPADPEMPILLVRDLSGQLRVIYVAYSMHPTFLHAESKLVSADYPGAMRVYFAKKFPSAVFMFGQGASGDQSSRYFRTGQTFAEAKRFADVLSEGIMEVIPQLSYTDTVELKNVMVPINVKLKDFSDLPGAERRLAECRRREQELIDAGASYTETQTANLWVLGAEHGVRYARLHAAGEMDAHLADNVPYTFQITLINDAAYVFLPGEIFVEFSLDIKERSPFEDTYVLTLSNGSLPGYCVTRDEAATGGYEVWQSMMDVSVGYDMADSVVATLQKING